MIEVRPEHTFAFSLTDILDGFMSEKFPQHRDVMLNNWGKVNLFTRPRRFGKTLNMSMLKSFFEIGADKTLFDGLAISKETALCEAYMGKFPVVFVSLKGVDGLTFEDAYGMLRRIIRAEVSRLQMLLDSERISEDDKKPLKRILKEEDTKDDIQNSLKTLSCLLYQHYGQKTVLLLSLIHIWSAMRRISTAWTFGTISCSPM